MNKYSIIGMISSIALAVGLGALFDSVRGAGTPMILIITIVWSMGGLGFVLGKIADGVNNSD